jgi:hypothetical protein
MDFQFMDSASSAVSGIESSFFPVTMKDVTGSRISRTLCLPEAERPSVVLQNCLLGKSGELLLDIANICDKLRKKSEAKEPCHYRLLAVEKPLLNGKDSDEISFRSP